jgi:hypothetical protein
MATLIQILTQKHTDKTLIIAWVAIIIYYDYTL